MSYSPETDAPHEEHYDPLGAKIGMWLFLYTELILFGGLFLVYAVYLTEYRADFLKASREDLNFLMGALNTLFLLTSSLTVVLSISALERGDKRRSVQMLAATILFAFAFFVVKYFEWSGKFHHGIFPGSPELDARGQGQTMFFGLYFVMTGLHGLHVLIGIILLAVMLALVQKGHITPERHVALENSGLYWHLVDMIWIFLFPLLYLIA